MLSTRADPDQMESLAIHMFGTNRLYFNEVEHVLDRKSLSTFPEHALEHFQQKWIPVLHPKML